jgi:hypothetical protein
VRLPQRAVLWEVTGTGEPRETDLPLPRGAAWINEGSATRTSDFTIEGDTSRRLFRLYESDAEPRIDDSAYVSGLTYSGVPTGSSKIDYLSLHWLVGIGAAILFFWMIAALARDRGRQGSDRRLTSSERGDHIHSSNWLCHSSVWHGARRRSRNNRARIARQSVDLSDVARPRRHLRNAPRGKPCDLISSPRRRPSEGNLSAKFLFEYEYRSWLVTTLFLRHIFFSAVCATP